MPLHLMNIADAPDSWRRRRTLESVSFVEASQLRSFDYLSRGSILGKLRKGRFVKNGDELPTADP
jgi:hypothetical protein